MKKRVWTILLVLSLLVSSSGVVAMAADAATVATIGDVTYTTLQDAVADVLEGNQDGTIVLNQSTEEDIYVNGVVYVDLNGNDIRSVTVENGTLYCMDKQTNDFVSETANDYGTIGTIDGNVQAAFPPVVDGYGYVMISENNKNASFHYVQLRITDMVLRPQNEGEEAYNPSLYYNCAFTGDDVVAANVESFGVMLSVVGVPSEIGIDRCGYSKFTHFTPGEAGNTQQSTLLRGIMKETNAYMINKRNAGLKVYGQAYLKLKDGSYAYGNPQDRTLQEQTELANLLWTRMNSEKKDGVREMYNRYTRIMQSWNLSALSDPFANTLVDVVTWQEEFENLPIANAGMKPDQLRQLTVDYFRLHLTYRWTPSKTFRYLDHEDEWTTLSVGEGYEGMPYCMDHAHYDSDGDGEFDKDSSGNDKEYSVGGGNLYKVMNYYDPVTGMLDIEKMGAAKNVFNILTSNCTGGLSWAWERVSNAAKLYSSKYYVPANGVLPVSGYTWNECEFTEVETTYNTDGTIKKQEIVMVDNAIEKIIGANKKGAFYKAYSRMKPGDGLISDGHVMMCAGVEVAYKDDGSIDSGNSYIWYIDQNAKGSTDRWVVPGGICEAYTYVNDNGTAVRNLGGLIDDPIKGNKLSFYWMLDKGYIPVTIPELCGEEWLNEYMKLAESYFIDTDREEEWNTVYAPAYTELYENRFIEPGSVSSTNNLSARSISLSTQLFKWNGAVKANYIISNVRVALEDAQGNVIMEENPHIATTDRTNSLKLYDHVMSSLQVLTQETLAPYAGAENYIRIQFRLSTGEWVNVLHAKLTA